MKIYSDTLTRDDLYATVAKVKGMAIDDLSEIKKAKVRKRGWTVQTVGNGNRRKNSGTFGADERAAASFDDHGAWFALLYQIDPSARIIFYENADDFHKRTEGKYKPAA